MAEDKKGALKSIFEFGLSHITDLATLWFVVKGNKPPEDAPGWAKAADNSPGGEGKPEDEASYANFITKIGTAPEYEDRTSLQLYLRNWVNEAYQLHHPERHVRERGRILQQDWRVIIKQMSIDYGEQAAIAYLTALAKTIRRYYMAEVRSKGKTLLTIKGRQKQACWEKACHRVNEELLADGIHVPGEAEVPYSVQIKYFFKDKVSPFNTEALKKLKAARGFSWKVLKTGWFVGILAGKKGKHWLDEKDRAFAKFTTDLEEAEASRLSWRGAFKRNRAAGQGRTSSLRNTPQTVRESRKGLWQRWTFRFAAKFTPKF